MLKIGIVRWRGKCGRHPRYDPYLDGVGGIKGGCPKCTMLRDIYECHQKMVSMMRTFSPPPPPKKKVNIDDELQTNLFDELG